MTEKKSIDKTVQQALERAAEKGIETVWDRAEKQSPHCGFGEKGLCCNNCYMGPCRIHPKGKSPQKGVCGATAEVIVARNFARMIAGGAAAHSDHGRDVANTLLEAATNPESPYSIKDTAKLNKIALTLGVATKERAPKDIARDVAEKALNNFGRQEGELDFLKMAPETRQSVWRKQGVSPRGIDREIVEMMHRTTMGVDHDPKNIMLQGSRTALADGWGGSMVATELQDILFGTPSPIRGEVNLGVLSETEVNIVVHGHEPVLSEMLVLAAQEKELLDLAKTNGAAGINLAGICCTANEILLRHGLPVAGNILQQELAVSTGAIEAMIVDVQCIMPSLPELCKCFHTKMITTSSKGRIEGAEYFELFDKNAYETAKEIVKIAIFNFPNRGHVEIPKEKMDLIAGFMKRLTTCWEANFGDPTPLSMTISSMDVSKEWPVLWAAVIPRSPMTSPMWI